MGARNDLSPRRSCAPRRRDTSPSSGRPPHTDRTSFFFPEEYTRRFDRADVEDVPFAFHVFALALEDRFGGGARGALR